ncbi:MAG TPA: hypothetical protein GX697_05820 [Firmicutes bacterium]|nr:hypothetical protein [Bacillota bacterium]
MTREEIRRLFDFALDHFTQYKREDLETIAQSWEKELTDIPYKKGRFAVFNLLSKSYTFPTAEEIIKVAKELNIY